MWVVIYTGCSASFEESTNLSQCSNSLKTVVWQRRWRWRRQRRAIDKSVCVRACECEEGFTLASRSDDLMTRADGEDWSAVNRAIDVASAGTAGVAPRCRGDKRQRNDATTIRCPLRYLLGVLSLLARSHLIPKYLRRAYGCLANAANARQRETEYLTRASAVLRTVATRCIYCKFSQMRLLLYIPSLSPSFF